jgi:hypothetical protein
MREATRVGWELTDEVSHQWGGGGETTRWCSMVAVVLR